MSLQEYALPAWFNTPNPVPPPHSRTGPHQNAAVFPDYDREPMFEKPLTPSDVGKLNRLVIPKQQAEKYLPLGDAASASAGSLLGFEDEEGKEWRFRYSYWNSSQSYVLTKGWSRYVKDKRLDAGDVVFFERHRADPRRMFIGSRRPGSAPKPIRNFFMPYRPGAEEQISESSNSRRQVRLFGVNLDCQLDNTPNQTTSFGSSFFSTEHHQHQQPYQYYYFDQYNHQNPHHMED
ncbi:hypothetical protein V2J09_007006 [Rumex salicifolius]